MIRKLLISLAINVPFAIWIYHFTAYDPNLPTVLEFLEPVLLHSMLWGSGALLGLTFKVYYPDTLRWWHLVLLSVVWGVSIVGALFGLLFFLGIPISVVVACRLMRVKNFWLTAGVLLMLAEVVGFFLFALIMRRISNGEGVEWIEYWPVWAVAALVGTIYVLCIHVMVIGGEELKRVTLSPPLAETKNAESA
ncbi:MAG: hypothetical protein MUF38_08945 [Anaerolineae bacterium]|nr:hypothetical protein [Anaerolineae bacterium]